jgi:hypothetical protein
LIFEELIHRLINSQFFNNDVEKEFLDIENIINTDVILKISIINISTINNEKKCCSIF